MRTLLVMILVGLATLAEAQPTTAPPPQTRLADGRYPDLFALSRDTEACMTRSGVTMERLFQIMEQIQRAPQAPIDPADAKPILAYGDCMNARGYVLPYQDWNK